MAPVVLMLRRYPREFRCRVVATAQHRHMLDQVLSLFGIAADHDLDVMTQGQSLSDVTIRVLERLEPVLKSEKPALVLVHGDTTTAMASSLAAFYQRVPVGHVEAGLRSFDRDNPFPEEVNRLIADSVSSLHFAPTSAARSNLRKTGVQSSGVFITGNTGIDALQLMVRRLQQADLPTLEPALRQLAEKPFVLVTAHRRESFGQPILNVCNALAAVAEERPDLHFVYPVHPNPNIAGPVHDLLGGRPNVHLLPPLGYDDFVYLMMHALFIVTDSGGLQEEAPSLSKPVLVLRDVTERPEAITAGTAKLIGTEGDQVLRWIRTLVDDQQTYLSMAGSRNPYGDGNASMRTVEAIRYFFGLRRTRPKPFSVAPTNQGGRNSRSGT